MREGVQAWPAEIELLFFKLKRADRKDGKAVISTGIPVLFYHRFPKIYSLLEFFFLNLSGRLADSSPCDHKRTGGPMRINKTGHFYFALTCPVFDLTLDISGI